VHLEEHLEHLGEHLEEEEEELLAIPREFFEVTATPLGPCLMGMPYSNILFLPESILQPGNTKIGRIWNFSVPAAETMIDGERFITCPGRSRWCMEKCYAKKGKFEFGVAKRRHHENLLETFKPDFPSILMETCGEMLTPGCKPRKIKYMRVHVAGDFYDEEYIRKWIKIVKESPEWRFWGTTRSWRIPKLRDALEELRALTNIQLFGSTDESIPLKEIEYLAEKGWREAGIEKSYLEEMGVGKAIRCPTLDPSTGTGSCQEHMYCFEDRPMEHVHFKIH